MLFSVILFFINFACLIIFLFFILCFCFVRGAFISQPNLMIAPYMILLKLSLRRSIVLTPVFPTYFLGKCNWTYQRDTVLDGIYYKLKTILISGSGRTCNSLPLFDQNLRKDQNYNMGAKKKEKEKGFKGHIFSLKSNNTFMY